MSDIDRSNIDAVYWAEQFCQHCKDNDWSLDDIDEGLMMAWFANYRFAVADPLTLRIEELEAENAALVEALTTVRFWGLDNVAEEVRDIAKAALEKDNE